MVGSRDRVMENVSGDKNNFESFPFQLISFIRLKRLRCIYLTLPLCILFYHCVDRGAKYSTNLP